MIFIAMAGAHLARASIANFEQVLLRSAMSYGCNASPRTGMCQAEKMPFGMESVLAMGSVLFLAL